ncbi:MAG: hypothetical protein ACJAUP_002918 [Cellvibrionaceae bacterium]|jgi:hypothetical protein
MDNYSLLLKSTILEINPNIFTYEELKDQFIGAYYSLSSNIENNSRHSDCYAIYPQLVSALHTENE